MLPQCPEHIKGQQIIFHCMHFIVLNAIIFRTCLRSIDVDTYILVPTSTNFSVVFNILTHSCVRLSFYYLFGYLH